MDSLDIDTDDEEVTALCKEMNISVSRKKPKNIQIGELLKNLPLELADSPSLDVANLIQPDDLGIIPKATYGELMMLPLLADEELLLLPSSSTIIPDIQDQLTGKEDEHADRPLVSDSSLHQDLLQPEPEPVLDFVNHEPQSECEYTIDSNRKRKAKAKPRTWDKNIVKSKRMKGEEYLGYRRDRKVMGNEKFKVLHDVPRPAREMGSKCTSTFCAKSKLRGCQTLTEEERGAIFSKFWKMISWEQRKQYVVSHVKICEKKQIKVKEGSRRSESKNYFLTVFENRIQVCMQTFLNTLGLKESTVRCWLSSSEYGIANTTKNNETDMEHVIKKVDMEFLQGFLNSLAKMPSHYCRASTSKQYLEPIVPDKNCLLKLYSEECEKAGKSPLSRWTLNRVFDEMNLSLFSPKKDQCDTCCAHKVGNITDEQYQDHIKEKDIARNEKNKDKELGKSGYVHVFTQDLQAVKLCPKLEASALYYKTKLCVHNFTMYNLASKDVYCYWFDETNAGLTASVFVTCIIDCLKKQLDQKSVPVILYSDGCTAQNRNVILSNALLHLAMEKNIVIEQKFLIKGHTQMECDAVHSSIEQKIKKQEIFLPFQYATVSKQSRPQHPYHVKYLSYDFFDDYSDKTTFIYDSIRPGRLVREPTVTDLHVLQYNPNGVIKYKLKFEDEYQELPRRSLRGRRPFLENVSRSKLYQGPIKITDTKYKHLQELKPVVPSDCHSYYDSLPH